MFDLIAFDADDTLWRSEDLYVAAQGRLSELLSRYAEPAAVQAVLDETEMRNLAVYGYGLKSFGLSLIEAAIELSQGRIAAGEIQTLIEIVKQALTADVQVLDGAEQTLAELGRSYPLMLITKGDSFHQEAKLAHSGLRGFFRHVEIVADKTAEVYAAILSRHGVSPSRFIMVGNSLRSDVIPVVELGGWAVHIPYALLWSHEHAEVPPDLPERWFELDHLADLPALLARLHRA